MKLEHIAIWVNDLEAMKHFYEHYFNTRASARYENVKTGFSSYFLKFATGGRIELSHKDNINKRAADVLGYAHIAISLGEKQRVDTLAAQFVNDGFNLLSGPRTTGDGYYEAVIEDPEGNLIELTV